jgi:hypothetical protein
MRYVLLFVSFLYLNAAAQGTAGEGAKFEYRSLIDMPTAGVLEKGFVGASTDILPFGTVITRLEVGAFDDISFGISYGGVNLIGAGNPDWYKLPGVSLRFRLFKESLLMPSITMGFDSQGKGAFIDSSSRYSIKSPGFFAATAKNFALLGYLSLHGSVNYSLETKDGDNFINLLIGFEKTLGPSLSILAEYDLAFNDNSTDYFGSGNGYLNVGVRLTMGEGFTLGIDLRDLLNNKKVNPSKADRGVRIEYIKSIF